MKLLYSIIYINNHHRRPFWLKFIAMAGKSKACRCKRRIRRKLYQQSHSCQLKYYQNNRAYYALSFVFALRFLMPNCTTLNKVESCTQIQQSELQDIKLIGKGRSLVIYYGEYITNEIKCRNLIYGALGTIIYHVMYGTYKNTKIILSYLKPIVLSLPYPKELISEKIFINTCILITNEISKNNPNKHINMNHKFGLGCLERYITRYLFEYENRNLSTYDLYILNGGEYIYFEQNQLDLWEYNRQIPPKNNFVTQSYRYLTKLFIDMNKSYYDCIAMRLLTSLPVAPDRACVCGSNKIINKDLYLCKSCTILPQRVNQKHNMVYLSRGYISCYCFCKLEPYIYY
jgi:hypothetical protein